MTDDGFEAQIGRLRFKVVKEWDLEGDVLGGSLEILPTKLGEDKGLVTYRPFSQFPPAAKDLALVVDESLLAETVRCQLGKMARQVAGKRFDLEAVSVFDVYRVKVFQKVKRAWPSTSGFAQPIAP